MQSQGLTRALPPSWLEGTPGSVEGVGQSPRTACGERQVLSSLAGPNTSLCFTWIHRTTLIGHGCRTRHDRLGDINKGNLSSPSSRGRSA